MAYRHTVPPTVNLDEPAPSPRCSSDGVAECKSTAPTGHMACLVERHRAQLRIEVKNHEASIMNLTDELLKTVRFQTVDNWIPDNGITVPRRESAVRFHIHDSSNGFQIHAEPLPPRCDLEVAQLVDEVSGEPDDAQAVRCVRTTLPCRFRRSDVQSPEEALDLDDDTKFALKAMITSKLDVLDFPEPNDEHEHPHKDIFADLHCGCFAFEWLGARRRERRRITAFRSRHEDSNTLDLALGAVICLNALVLSFNLEYEGLMNGVQIGLIEDSGFWQGVEPAFMTFEYLFTFIFIIELVLRITLYGWKYYLEFANMFDAGLVGIAIADLLVLRHLTEQTDAGNLTILRFGRVFKLVRVLRVIRVMKLFSSLRVLVRTISSSFKSLVWSMVLLTIIMMMAGVFMCQLLSSTITDEDIPWETRLWAYTHYGTSSRAMYTMFEVTMSGCWPNYARTLIFHISPWFALFYLLYVTIVVFAIIRIITAIFLKETLNIAGSDADMMIADQMKKKTAYLEKLELAFEAIDDSGDGTITREEFDEILENPKVKAYMAVLELEIHESDVLFKLLDDEGSGVTYADFLQGVLRLKGQARTLDIVTIQHDCNKILREVHALRDLCSPKA